MEEHAEEQACPLEDDCAQRETCKHSAHQNDVLYDASKTRHTLPFHSPSLSLPSFETVAAAAPPSFDRDFEFELLARYGRKRRLVSLMFLHPLRLSFPIFLMYTLLRCINSLEMLESTNKRSVPKESRSKERKVYELCRNQSSGCRRKSTPVGEAQRIGPVNIRRNGRNLKEAHTHAHTHW